MAGDVTGGLVEAPASSPEGGTPCAGADFTGVGRVAQAHIARHGPHGSWTRTPTSQALG